MSAFSAETKFRPVPANDIVCVCGSRNLADLGPCRSPGGGRCTNFEIALNRQMDPGRLYRCEQCHLGLRLPRPDDATIASLYEGLPATRWKNETVAGSAQQYLVRRLTRQQQQSLKILDIGAFDGSFLRALPATFEKAAIEPSEAAAQLEQHNISVLKPFLEPAGPGETRRYDVVTMFDVFEHLADPLQGMKSAMSYVRPGGLLFVGTGNMDHWSWRHTRGTHWYLDPIQHVVVGSRRHFEWEAARIGASSQRTMTFSHQPGPASQRIRQALTAVYFGARERGILGRITIRTMNLFSTFRKLAHKQAMPYTQQLHDHILAEFVRSEAAE